MDSLPWWPLWDSCSCFLSRHWGLGQLDSRLEASYESPTGETIEYLRSHIDAVDAAFVLLAIVLGLALAHYARKAVRLPKSLTGLAMVTAPLCPAVAPRR